MNYPILVIELSTVDGGGFLGVVPDLPGCQGDGDTPEAALHDAQDAIDEWVETAKTTGRQIPLPGTAKALHQFSDQIADGVQ